MRDEPVRRVSRNNVYAISQSQSDGLRPDEAGRRNGLPQFRILRLRNFTNLEDPDALGLLHPNEMRKPQLQVSQRRPGRYDLRGTCLGPGYRLWQQVRQCCGKVEHSA
jgi:hypothetical protein